MGGDEAQPLVPSTAVYNYWKEFDLETLRAKLDEKGLAIAEIQESSVKSRKQLAEKTKEFKRSVAPDVFKQMASLLKAYQEEIDALTTRSKLGESAFLEVFKRLYEAPDPAPAIGQGLEVASRAAELETQVAKITQELSEYKEESKELKNQDVTIRRLEETIRGLEAQLAEKDGEIDAARAAAAAELEARTADEAQAREERLEAELQRAEAALEAMRRMHQATQAQLFNVQERNEEAAATARVEAEVAAVEVERAQERLVLLAQERDALLAKMSSRKNESGDDSDNDDDEDEDAHLDTTQEKKTKKKWQFKREPVAMAALREELNAQRELTARLQAELSAASRTTGTELAATKSKVAGLQASLAAAEAHASALEAELSSRPTQQELEEARQQIRVLNAVVHNAVGDDGEEGEGGEEEVVEKQGQEQEDGDANARVKRRYTSQIHQVVGSLESALLAKNRHLEHKLTMARLEAAEGKSSAENAAARITELEASLERQQALVQKLEDDLIMASNGVGGEGFHHDNDGGAAASAAATAEESSLGAALVSGMDILGSPTTTNSKVGGHLGEDSTMIGVLLAQRDRLRGRLRELESSQADATQALVKAKQDVAAARADNVALVEQLRYVQGYGSGGVGVGGGGGTAKLKASKQQQQQRDKIDVEAGSVVVGRYMKEYEDRVNPLSDFRTREREARKRAMSLQDRAAMALGSALVSGSRVAKSAIIVYAFVLHLIAFIVIAGFSHQHANTLDKLEELCGGSGGASGGISSASASGGGGAGAGVEILTDPVVGGAVAATVQDTIRRHLFF